MKHTEILTSAAGNLKSREDQFGPEERAFDNAAQIASIMLTRPKLRRLFVGDESFRHVSADRRPAVRAMLQQMVKELGFQIILVTHSREIATGNVVEIGS